MQKERYVLLELTYMTNVTFKESILFFLYFLDIICSNVHLN